MITTRQIKLINDTFVALHYAFGSIGWIPYAQRLVKLTEKESRDHDGLRPNNVKRGMPILSEAKYFAIKRYAEYKFLGEQAPTAGQWFHIQHSCYAAYAMASDEKLQSADSVKEFNNTRKDDCITIASWDYSELIAD